MIDISIIKDMRAVQIKQMQRDIHNRNQASDEGRIGIFGAVGIAHFAVAPAGRRPVGEQ